MKKFFFAVCFCVQIFAFHNRSLMASSSECSEAVAKLKGILGDDSWAMAEKSLPMQILYFYEDLQAYGAAAFKLKRPSLENIRDIKMVDKNEAFSEFYVNLIDAMLDADFAISYGAWSKKIKELYILKWAKNSSEGKSDLKRMDLKAIIDANPWADFQKVKDRVSANMKIPKAPVAVIEEDSVSSATSSIEEAEPAVSDSIAEYDADAKQKLNEGAQEILKLSADAKVILEDLLATDPDMEDEPMISAWIEFFHHYRDLLKKFRNLYSKYQYLEEDEVKERFHSLALKLDLIEEKTIEKYKSLDPELQADGYSESLDEFDDLILMLQRLEE